MFSRFRNFLFDPLGDYLKPPLQGFRLQDGKYEPIAPAKNRLPSQTLRLHLERDGEHLRLHDPKTGQWLRTPAEDRKQTRAENEELRKEVEEIGRASCRERVESLEVDVAVRRKKVAKGW